MFLANMVSILYEFIVFLYYFYLFEVLAKIIKNIEISKMAMKLKSEKTRIESFLVRLGSFLIWCL